MNVHVSFVTLLNINIGILCIASTNVTSFQLSFVLFEGFVAKNHQREKEGHWRPLSRVSQFRSFAELNVTIHRQVVCNFC